MFFYTNLNLNYLTQQIEKGSRGVSDIFGHIFKCLVCFDGSEDNLDYSHLWFHLSLQLTHTKPPIESILVKQLYSASCLNTALTEMFGKFRCDSDLTVKTSCFLSIENRVDIIDSIPLTDDNLLTILSYLKKLMLNRNEY